jgi:hypothetical protein
LSLTNPLRDSFKFDFFEKNRDGLEEVTWQPALLDQRAQNTADKDSPKSTAYRLLLKHWPGEGALQT